MSFCTGLTSLEVHSWRSALVEFHSGSSAPKKGTERLVKDSECAIPAQVQTFAQRLFKYFTK